MSRSAFALTARMPDPTSLLAALHAGGPDLRVDRAGQGAVVRLCTEDGRQVVAVEAPRYIQVPGEAARLLDPAVATETPVWWTEVRAASAVPEAPRPAASIAGRLATLLDGTTWPRETAAHADVVTVAASGEPAPALAVGDDVLTEADMLTDRAAIVLPDIPVIATQWVTHTRLGVEEHFTLAFGHTADNLVPLDHLPHLAEELAIQHHLATMVTEVRAARPDLTVPAHYEPPALPVSLTFGPGAIADTGPSRVEETLPDTPVVRLGPAARPTLHCTLGDGTDPAAWRRLRHAMAHLRVAPAGQAVCGPPSG
ncbi:DUF6177 family protein [Streptomyces sp. NPDC057197]|uniref:DUF6177 family protein n=1 Tax=Streptomyces sp. NPDC057197 TaxID=3346045 RepID=UPI003643967D